jgi:hypothetical protein
VTSCCILSKFSTLNFVPVLSISRTSGTGTAAPKHSRAVRCSPAAECCGSPWQMKCAAGLYRRGCSASARNSLHSNSPEAPVTGSSPDQFRRMGASPEACQPMLPSSRRKPGSRLAPCHARQLLGIPASCVPGLAKARPSTPRHRTDPSQRESAVASGVLVDHRPVYGVLHRDRNRLVASLHCDGVVFGLHAPPLAFV